MAADLLRIYISNEVQNNHELKHCSNSNQEIKFTLVFIEVKTT